MIPFERALVTFYRPYMIAALYGLEVCGRTHLPNSQKPPISVKSEDTDGISKHRLMPYFGACVIIVFTVCITA